MLCACLGSNNYKEQRANMLKNPAGRASSEVYKCSLLSARGVPESESLLQVCL